MTILPLQMGAVGVPPITGTGKHMWQAPGMVSGRNEDYRARWGVWERTC